MQREAETLIDEAHNYSLALYFRCSIKNLLYKKIIVGKIATPSDYSDERCIVVFNSGEFNQDNAFEMMRSSSFSWRHRWWRRCCEVKFYGTDVFPYTLLSFDFDKTDRKSVLLMHETIHPEPRHKDRRVSALAGSGH